MSTHPTGRPDRSSTSDDSRPEAEERARTGEGDRDVQPEGRRGQDHVDRQPGRQPRRIRPPGVAGGPGRAGRATAGLGVPLYELAHTIHNLLVEPRVSIDDVIIHTRVKNMDLVPSNIDLSAAEIQLVNEVGRGQSLARSLHPVLDRYDYVLIDCQPSLGLLTVNGLACSDGVIIPTECEYFSLRGLALLTDTVDKVHDRLNPKLSISGILITRYDPRTVNAREVMARVLERFGDLVFDTVITRTVRFPETSVAGEPITTWAPKSGGAQAYRSLAREVIDRFGS